MKTPGAKEIADWKTQRAKGKWFFVLKFALLCSLASVAGVTVFNYFYDGLLTFK